MAQNQKQWSSATPGLMVIMVDQSGSMLNPYIENDSRTVFSAKVINRVINTLINKNFNMDKPKDRCFVSVIGYGSNARDLCSGKLSELYANPLRIEEGMRKVSDGDGGLVETKVKNPIWVEPITKDEWTNMKGAFEMAKEIVSGWMTDPNKKDCPAPVIINISDGAPYYDHKDVKACMEETKQVAQEIMSMSNEDGNVLIFNAQIGTGAFKSVFPCSQTEVSGEEAVFLYDISSEIPEGFKAAAVQNELPIKEGSRGCIFNADAEELIKLLNFGSSKGTGDVK